MSRRSSAPADQRLLVADSFLQTLFRSRFWNVSQFLRGLGQVARPVRFGASALQPARDLDRDPHAGRSAWEAVGRQPQFVIPCLLPAGDLRVRVRLHGEAAGRLTLSSLPASPAAPVECLHEAAFAGTLDAEFVVRLRQPALGLRLDPLGGPGKFSLDAFEVRQVNPLAAAWHRARQRARARTRVAAPAQPGARPAVTYVLLSAGLCGGVRVILEHAAGLRARGWDVQVWHVDGDPAWFGRPLSARRFETVDDLRRALATRRGVKVATWYETAPWVAASLRDGDRGYYMVQDIEESYATSPEQAARALSTYQLPLQPLTEGSWVHRQLESRFGLSPAYVGIGVGLDVFSPGPEAREPHRLLTQARTWSGGGLKGWPTARAVVLRAHELNARTAVTTFSIEEAPDFPAGLDHRHVIDPTDGELAGLYRRAGAYLLTSSHEGFGLTAAEAMACGCPVVSTQADGNEEFCLDGKTALTAPVGDVERLARHVVRLQTEPELAAELARNARAFIEGYTWDRVLDQLEELYRAPVAGAAPAVRPLPELADGARDRPRPVVAPGEHPRINLPAAGADVTLVIPTINDVQQVARCVTTARQFAPAGAEVQVVVVDDGSADPRILEELGEAARELDFELLANHQNLGFSATVNHGLRHARGELIVLCNNDIAFDGPWLEPLRAAFARDARVGVVGARLRYPDGLLQHAGMDKVAGGLRFHHTHAREPGDHPPALQSRHVWSVTGALLALRRETVRRLGGLSTGYSLTYEDVDYCLRAWSEGIRVWYDADLTCLHLEGSTRGTTPSRKYARSPLWAERERNSEGYFDRKWHALQYADALEPFLALSEQVPPVGGVAEERVPGRGRSPVAA